MWERLIDLDPGPHFPGLVRMVVEVPEGSTNKYEYDPELSVFRLDRTLYSPMHFPGNYGFFPGTFAADGEPLDVLCLTSLPGFPGCLVEVRPLGMLSMRDENQLDHKVIAVPTKDPRFDEIKELEHLFPHVRRELEHFFTIYKELETGGMIMEGWHGLEETYATMSQSREAYQARVARA